MSKLDIKLDMLNAFGFTGFNVRKPTYDEFELYVWETRKAAGIVEPKPEPIESTIAGQILWTGTIDPLAK